MLNEGPSQWDDAFDKIANKDRYSGGVGDTPPPSHCTNISAEQCDHEQHKKAYLRKKRIPYIAILGKTPNKVPPEVSSEYAREEIRNSSKINYYAFNNPPKGQYKYQKEDSSK